MAGKIWRGIRLTSMFFAMLASIVVSACESTVTVESTDLSKVKLGAPRPEIEKALGKPMGQEQSGPWVLVRYPYMIGNSERVTTATEAGGGGGDGPLGGLLVAIVLLPVIVATLTGIQEVKKAAARSRLKKEGARVLTLIYDANGKAEWIGSKAISPDLLTKAKAGKAAAQHEIALVTLGKKEQWGWECRSANQGYGPALLGIPDLFEPSEFQKYTLYLIPARSLDDASKKEAIDAKKRVASLLEPKMISLAQQTANEFRHKVLCDPNELANVKIPDIAEPIVERERYAPRSRSEIGSANCGDANAQEALGIRYQDGIRTAKNLTQAYVWFTLSQRNMSEINRWYADEYRDTIREQLTPEQMAEADRRVEAWKSGPEVCKPPWQKLATNLKDANCGVVGAQDWLGLRYQEGEGREKNLPESYVWYGLAQRHATNKYDRLLADYQRDVVRSQLMPAQIADAEERIEAWEPDESACRAEAKSVSTVTN